MLPYAGILSSFRKGCCHTPASFPASGRDANVWQHPFLYKKSDFFIRFLFVANIGKTAPALLWGIPSDRRPLHLARTNRWNLCRYCNKNRRYLLPKSGVPSSLYKAIRCPDTWNCFGIRLFSAPLSAGCYIGNHISKYIFAFYAGINIRRYLRLQ